MIERHDQFIVTCPDVPEAVTFIQERADALGAVGANRRGQQLHG
jgi:hypothetical protein